MINSKSDVWKIALLLIIIASAVVGLGMFLAPLVEAAWTKLTA